ncbi:MAG: hypothetical protein Q4F30_07095 [Akkermansia sp.]|nr:hypothetical protein [Akkermansia sp.]
MVPIYRYLDAHQDFDEKDVRDFLRKEKPFSVLDYGKDAWRLQDVMVADELYASYPILKNALIHFEKLERGLFGMARGGAITLNSRNDDNEQKRTIVHEVQHVIQELEGVATGGSEDFARSVLEDAISYAEARRGDAQAALESYEKIRGPQGLHRPDYAKRVKEADDRVKELEALRNANLSDFDLYERLAGEIEARNVEQRLDLSERRRFLNPFNYTLDTRAGEAIPYNSEWLNITFSMEGEMAALKDAAIADGTFMTAPNGKPTKLTERQWLQVRTKAFKKWFGDWENDTENASKVLDENGEPRVFYHGSWWDTLAEKPGDRVFDINFLGSASGDNGYFGNGFYFVFDAREAKFYGGIVNEYFLNMRNPLYVQEELDTIDGYRPPYASDFALILNLSRCFPDLVKDKRLSYVNT